MVMLIRALFERDESRILQAPASVSSGRPGEAVWGRCWQCCGTGVHSQLIFDSMPSCCCDMSHVRSLLGGGQWTVDSGQVNNTDGE